MSYRRVSPDDLADAIQQELSGYLASLQIRMNAAALKAMKRLVQLTKSTAPRGKRGSFAKSIKMEQWDKQDRYWLQDEQRYQVVYEFEFTEKGGY